MLRKDIFAIIRTAKKEQLEVGMITNGTLITKTSAENLCKSELDSITFSIDAPASGPHDAIRGVEGSWKKAIEGMRYISRAKQKYRNKNLKVSLDVVVARINYQLIDKLIALRTQLGYDEIHFLPVIPKTPSAINLLFTSNDLKDFQTNYLPSIRANMRDSGLSLSPLYTLISLCRNRESTLAGKYALPGRNEVLCFQPWQMATIDPFGNVYPCCYTCTFQNLSEDLMHGFLGIEDFNMGNLRSSTFREIWNGEDFRKFRNRCKSSPLPSPMCAYCNYNYRYDLLLTALFKRRKLLLKFIYSLFKRNS